MEPRQPVEHPLAVLVAQLIARDERHEQKPEQHREHEYPQQGVSVVGARGRHVHHVPRTQPGEDDDDARTEGADVLEKGPWDRSGRRRRDGDVWHGGGRYSDTYADRAFARFRTKKTHNETGCAICPGIAYTPVPL